MSSVELSSLKKLKVTELKELLTKEGLSVTGKKEELFQRITEHYKSKGLIQTEEEDLPELAPPENFDWSEASLSNDADLPPELRGDLNDSTLAENTGEQLPEELATKTSTPPKETADVKELESSVEHTTETKEGEEKTEEEASKATAEETKANEERVAAELEKRRQRALRFGIPLSESTKVVERAMKFGTDEKATNVSPLDLPLGEGQRNHRGQPGNRGRGGRGRGGRFGYTNPQSNLKIEPETLKKRQERFGVVNNQAASSVPIDSEEQERRKKRAERFGNLPQNQDESPSKKSKPEA